MPEMFAPDRKTWRAWLEKNHGKHDKVWVLMYKRHTGKPAINHRESIEEAICFGWIDTIVKRIDDDIYARQFVKRKKDASWSSNTLRYAKKLTEEGRMTPAGKEAYERGRKKLPHDHGIPDDPDTPDDLQEALSDAGATASWEALAPSYRKTYLRWLFQAKRPETREKRIQQILDGAKKGRRLGQ